MILVNDLLDLARLETGQLHLHPEAVKLKQVCDRAIRKEALLKARTFQSVF